MKRVVNVFLIIILLILINFSSVYAVGINMDLTTDNTNVDNAIVNTTDNTIDNTTDNTTSNISEENLDIQAPMKVSTTSTSEDFHLTVSNIIDIILIAVGIVIIFLAIAILLKIR